MDRATGIKTEEKALRTLSTLNSYVVSLGKEEHMRRHAPQQLDIMRGLMERVGLKVEDLDRLNIIHVTGTKGKGSTCAFTEQILKSHGIRTGFFSSPHLVHFRERFRINGECMAEELFAKYFWHVYDQLEETKDAHGGMMPTTFRLLTLLAFYVFLQEKVDVVIMEVGIGGAYDCTNVIRNPWVCGITTLDIDHVEILGDTIDKIAWHKAGIFKPGVPAFTVKQSEEAMAVLRDRAKEIGCPLLECPELEDYQADCGPFRLGLIGQHQHTNAALALQLSHTWLQKKQGTDESSLTMFKPSPLMVKALAEIEWPGRNQTVKHGAVTYFLDGAHTMLSMKACTDWFIKAAAEHERKASGRVIRVLLFNTVGERDSASMLKLLVPCHFDFAVFCPNIDTTSDKVQPHLFVSEKDMDFRFYNERSWRLYNNLGDDQKPSEDSLPLEAEKKGESHVFPCIFSALQWITQGRDSMVADLAEIVAPAERCIKSAALQDASEIHVLVTGSLYLVGGVLRIFQLPPRKWNM